MTGKEMENYAEAILVEATHAKSTNPEAYTNAIATAQAFATLALCKRVGEFRHYLEGARKADAQRGVS